MFDVTERLTERVIKYLLFKNLPKDRCLRTEYQFDKTSWNEFGEISKYITLSFFFVADFDMVEA